VLDHDGAVLHAVHAVGAVPHGVDAHGVVDEVLLALGNLGGRGVGAGRLGGLGGRRVERRAREPVVLDVLDKFLGRELLARQVGRAAVLATAASRAGVAVEDLLPGEFLELAHAEALGVLEVADGLELPHGLQGGHELVGGRGHHVQHPREGNVGDEAEGQEGVRPPQDLVGGLEGLQVDPDEELPHQVAQEGPFLEVGVARGDDADALDDVARHHDGQDEEQDDGVFGPVIGRSLVAETVGFLDVAPVDRQDDAHDGKEAEKIHDEGKGQVPFAGQVDPRVERGGVDGGSPDQDEEGEEDESVDQSWVEVPPHGELQDAVSEKVLDALAPVVIPDLRLPHGLPEIQTRVEPVAHDGQGDEREDVEGDLVIRGIPEYLPSFVAGSKYHVLHTSRPPFHSSG